MVHEIENFYGVYILYCLNPKYKGRTYIGFTIDPNRRVQQHNGGVIAGGAKRTNGRGPWEMVLIVHGFPNKISALRFEWALTKPQMSKRLRHLPRKRKKETHFNYRIRIMCEMLRIGPWTRLPLTIRWLKQEFFVEFDPKILPPPHMPIEYGPVKSTKVKHAKRTVEKRSITCLVCKSALEMNCDGVSCLGCQATSHIVCLGQLFLHQQREAQELIPIEGSCPSCNMIFLWGDLIRFKRGCYRQQLTGSTQQELLEEDSASD